MPEGHRYQLVIPRMVCLGTSLRVAILVSRQPTRAIMVFQVLRPVTQEDLHSQAQLFREKFDSRPPPDRAQGSVRPQHALELGTRPPKC